MEEGDVYPVCLAHGDLDGVISAAMIGKVYGTKSEDYGLREVRFTQPHEIDRVAVKPNEILFVVDIAVNNRDPAMTLKFVQDNRDRIALWFDHHRGWSGFLGKVPLEVRNRFTIDESAPSCARVLYNTYRAWVPESWERNGTASDTGQLDRLSEDGWLLYKAIKADIRDEEAKRRAVRWLLHRREEDYEFLRRKAEEYDRGPGNIEPLLSKIKLIEGVAVMEEDIQGIDRLRLFLEMERMSPLGVGVMRGRTEYGEVISVGTGREDIDLVKVFNLRSGNPRNVILPASSWKIEDVVALLTKRVK